MIIIITESLMFHNYKRIISVLSPSITTILAQVGRYRVFGRMAWMEVILMLYQGDDDDDESGDDNGYYYSDKG